MSVLVAEYGLKLTHPHRKAENEELKKEVESVKGPSTTVRLFVYSAH